MPLDSHESKQLYCSSFDLAKPMQKPKYYKSRRSQGRTMLTTLTRKLCPLLSLAMATIGCGKKLEDAETKSRRSTENQELPSTYVIQLDGGQVYHKNYFLTESAQFKIPDRIRVRQGSTSGKVVEIAHDVNEYDGEDFFYKCSYKASANPNEMILDKCVDYDGDDFGDVSNHIFTLYKNEVVQMRFAGAPSADLIVEAIYSMNWIYPN